MLLVFLEGNIYFPVMREHFTERDQIFRTDPQQRSHGFGALPHQADFELFYNTVSTNEILEFLAFWHLAGSYYFMRVLHYGLES